MKNLTDFLRTKPLIFLPQIRQIEMIFLLLQKKASNSRIKFMNSRLLNFNLQKILTNYNFVFVAVLRRAFSGILFKRFTKVAEIIKTAFVANLVYTYWFFGQKF